MPTRRLILRSLQPDDLDAFAEIYAHPDVVGFVGDGATASREETAEWLARTISRNHLEGWDMRSVVRAKDGVLLGRCGIAVQDIDGKVEHEVGYVFGRPYWGRGYATEAATAVRDHALSDRGLTRLIALIAHQNEASKRVAHKLGMSFERAAEFRGRVVELYALEA